MNVRTIDHVNLRIPADGLADARAFYADGLGLSLEGVDRFEAGEKPFFDVRLAPEHVIHLWPTDDFDPPTATNYDHVALVVEEDVETVRTELGDAGIDVEQELDSPLGATGEAGAVYVRDPFGYRVELKEPVTDE
ncbi:VOC family protein [Halobaculum marinum]|uniref:VOC family protein n=1 Tax=Halobaculum marinum TaxID=3031996 RepID=A0ABD5WYH7_9EURY|nr:VOC family protein [Halobaculum sp. DT55]